MRKDNPFEGLERQGFISINTDSFHVIAEQPIRAQKSVRFSGSYKWLDSATDQFFFYETAGLRKESAILKGHF
ncbi:MAG: hypothetical protein ACE5HS_14105 [bacterium]